jgi:hypothetical protein
MTKQTKFSALIPRLLSQGPDPPELAENPGHFWHSFFLLRPEFPALQTHLLSGYSVDAVRRLVSRCLKTIESSEKSPVSSLKRANAAYLLVQLFESLWPRLRTGTFGVDAINVLCGLEAADAFFDLLFASTLRHPDAGPVLVLLSLLSATRDVETNALTDFFIAHCPAITEFCLAASDLHLLLFSLLLQLDRPSGPFTRHFRSARQPPFKSLVANMIARSAQLFVCCRAQPATFLRKAAPRPLSATLGLFNPGDFQLPMCFALFAPFVDASILCFFELASDSSDCELESLELDGAAMEAARLRTAALGSSALALLSHLVAFPSLPHAADRVKMLVIAFEFWFDWNRKVPVLTFDHQQFRACFNTAVCEPRDCKLGAMALDVLAYLLEQYKSILPISHLIGRTIYTIIAAFVENRGQHNVDWYRLFTRLFGFCNRTYRLPCEYNGYAIATTAMCASYRPALFKRDDGFVHMIRALAKDPVIALCEYRPPDALLGSAEFLKKCKVHVEKLAEVVRPEFADLPFEQVQEAIRDLKVDEVLADELPPMERLSECPTFTQFFHIYARQHCEAVQALLHYTVSHIG